MPPAATIDVTAPSRLHFGMLSFGQPDTRQYGGVGVAIDAPGVRLRITPADSFQVEGPLAARVRDFVGRLSDGLNLEREPQCRIEVLSAPPEHVGLGTGTQLGLAVAAGVTAFLGADASELTALAQLVGRGERSAIGTYAFGHGGLLVEAGKLEGDLQSPLISRVELPDDWRFVLICPHGTRGLSGQSERRAFADLPPVPTAATAALCREVLLHLLPAAAEGLFEQFSESMYRYGHMAGLCFAANQGGPYATPRLAELVQEIRELGVRGVGQSSWGPTLFALLPDEAAAERFIERMNGTSPGQLDLTVAAPTKRGARVQINSSENQ